LPRDICEKIEINLCVKSFTVSYLGGHVDLNSFLLYF